MVFFFYMFYFNKSVSVGYIIVDKFMYVLFLEGVQCVFDSVKFCCFKYNDLCYLESLLLNVCYSQLFDVVGNFDVNQ